MITVLHYAPGFKTGGIESRLLDWYRNIDRNIIRFVLVKLNEEDDTANIQEFLELGGVFYNLPPFSMKSAILFSYRIGQIIHNENVDIVHVHDVNSGLFVLREAKKKGVPCRILHSRTTSYLPKEKNVMIKTILRKNANRYANYYFSCSVEAGKWGIGEKYQNQIYVIKNGIQTERFIFNQDTRDYIRKQLGVSNNKVIGTVGRLSDQKNIPFLLSVFEQLLIIDDQYRLVIVGDGDRTILEDYFEKHPISEYVLITGDKKDVWNYYMAFDVFCGTSLYEGFGTTAIESQATGLPTIISDRFPETVVVSNHIWRLPIDDIDLWVKLVIEQIGNRYAAAGEAAVNTSGYNAKMVANELELFYINCIKHNEGYPMG